MFMKTARLFRNGRSQAVRLPKELRFEGVKEVRIRREGKNIVLEPIEEFSWAQWWKSWNPVGDDLFPEGREQPSMQKRDLNFD
jgi:antitoxin VapB